MYLEVVSPLCLPLKQGIQDTPTGFSAPRVISAHHIVGSTNPLEELLVNILSAAVIGNISEIDVDGWPWWNS